MKEVEIYYFSGSGNSLYVARELQKRLPEATLTPIVGLLGHDSVKTDAQSVGFVFPIHGITIPIPMKQFVRKLDLESAEYIFAVATRGGTKHNAFVVIEKALRRSGRSLGSTFTLDMADNNPKFKDWHQATKEEIERIESDIRGRLDSLQKVISYKEKRLEEATDGVTIPVGFLVERLCLLGMFDVERTGLNNYFYTGARCAGCKTCEKVCPSGKIKMVDKRPTWQNDVKCYFCYACLNYCPKQSVQIKSKWYMKSYTEQNERYPHPYATADDIARQKMK